MSGWRWVGRAVVFGIAFVALCLSVGEWLGSAAAPVKGIAVLVGFLGGGALAVNWVGGAGLWAVAIGLVVMLGLGVESEQSEFVKSVTFVESEDVWPEGARAVHFGQPLLHRGEWGASYQWSQTFNNRTESRTTTAVPLVAKAGGPVVAFDCYERVRDESPDGRWAVHVSSDCGDATRRAKEKLAAAKQVLAPGADTRIVNVYRSREDFEASGDVGVVYRMAGVFMLLYVLGVVLYRNKAALP